MKLNYIAQYILFNTDTRRKNEELSFLSPRANVIKQILRQCTAILDQITTVISTTLNSPWAHYNNTF
jgi:hypothetical protein